MKKLLLALTITGLLIFSKNGFAKAQTCTTTPPTNTGRVTLTATITNPGTYRVWSRIKVPDSTNNSFYIQIDGGCAILVGGLTAVPANSWTWVDYKDGNTSNKINANLSAGSHVITVIGKGNGVGIDKLLLTQNLSCIPVGKTGDNCPAVTPTNTPTPTLSPAHTPTPTPTPTPTAIPTKTPTPLPTNTPTPTFTPTPTALPTPTITPTITPNATILRFASVKLHGIGRGGDNTNPDLSGNQNPQKTTRTLSIEFEDSNGTSLPPIQGKITFQPGAGDFSGDIVIPNTIPNGSYLVKVKSPQFLKKRILGILTVNQGTVNQVPPVALIAGDVNNDNLLTLADYNILVECYSDLLPAKNCTDASKKAAADISDDGKINSLDYNLFLRELSVVKGD